MESPTQTLPCAALESVRDAIRTGAEFLHRAGVDSPRLDAEVLLCRVLGVERAGLYLDPDWALTEKARRELQNLLSRRAGREPLAYITGRKEFWSLDFFVTPDVLIPRPETELLVELAVELSTQRGGAAPLKILDLCTGSGVIAVSLAKELPQTRIVALDISPAAIEIARLNGRLHGVEGRVEFFCGDLFAPLAERLERFDIVVANPPYIRSGDLPDLEPEVREWEPVGALDGGADGLCYYRRIVAAVGAYLKTGGSVLLELGDGMGEAVRRMFADVGGYARVRVRRDYGGKDRVIRATKFFPAADSPEGKSRG